MQKLPISLYWPIYIRWYPASFGMLGDLNIAEPAHWLVFAGPRVIKETIKKILRRFQRSNLSWNMASLIFCTEKGLKEKIEYRAFLLKN